MNGGSDFLDDIAAQLKQGKGAWRKFRTVLKAFGYSRRRESAVSKIHQELQAKGLLTDPEITSTLSLSESIKFSLKEQSSAEYLTQARVVVEVPDDDDEGFGSGLPTLGDISITVGTLRAATKPPVRLPQDATIDDALTHMELHNCAHIVIISGKNTVKGVVSFSSIARAQLRGNVSHVRECIENGTPEASIDDPLLDVMSKMWSHDVTLVRDQNNSVSGLVTPADVAEEVGLRAEPFFLVGEIENLLKWLIKKRNLSVKDFLGDKYEGKGTVRVDNMDLGDIERIMQHEKAWDSLNVPYNGKTVSSAFTSIRQFRNDLMHFRRTLTAEQVEELRRFLSLVRKMCKE